MSSWKMIYSFALGIDKVNQTNLKLLVNLRQIVLLRRQFCYVTWL